MKLTLWEMKKSLLLNLPRKSRDQFNHEGKYALKDIPGFEGTLEQLNDLKIDKFINSHKI